MAIIATKKYIDLHYLHTYDADTLLSRLKKLKSDNDIFSQLPSNMIIGLVTGVISGMMINALSFNQDDNIEFYIIWIITLSSIEGDLDKIIIRFCCNGIEILNNF